MKSRQEHSAYNEIKLEKIKIVFQFLLMCVCSVFMGICIVMLLSENSLDKLMREICHYYDCVKVGELKEPPVMFLQITAPDVLCILTIFVFSFSFINYFVTDIVIAIYGIRLGVNSTIIFMGINDCIPLRSSLSYAFFRGLFLVALLTYSCGVSFSSLEIKSFSRQGRIILNKKIFLRLIVTTLSIIGIALIINGIYFLLLI